MKTFPLSRRFRALALLAAGLFSVTGPISTVARAATSDAHPDSSSGAPAGDNSSALRGIERDRREGGQGLKTAGNVLLFVPRSLISGFLYATVYCGQLMDDHNVVSSLDELLHSRDRTLGWYPVLTAGSGPAIGAAVFYRSPTLGVSAGGAYGGTDRWAVRGLSSYTFRTGTTVWEIQAAGRLVDRDDHEFYGFGSDPQSDPRNQFQQGGSEFLTYTQQLRRYPITLGVRPSADWQMFYTFYYQERRLSIPDYAGSGPDPVAIPGVEPGVKTSEDQIYNEISAQYDSRDRKKLISSGVRIEGYGGMAEGRGGYQARFGRAGLGASAFVPVLRRDRIIVPRLVFDMIDEREDDEPVSFADYPRQPTFRGVSAVTLLRTDKYSLVPSLEYHWPMTYGLSGGVFVDYLLVSHSLDALTFSDAPYAIGLDITLHSAESEVARLTLSSGSEGFRFLLSLGFSQRVGDRKDWQ